MALGYPEYGRLRRVLMHSPGAEIDRIRPASFRRYLFEDAIEPERFRSQHARLVDTLRGEGVDVLLAEDLLRGTSWVRLISRSPNLIYTRDTVAVTRGGFVRMRMKSAVRRSEPRIAAAALERLGVHTLVRVEAPATMEGGDLIFPDEETLLVGIGNRTSALALRQLRGRTQTDGLRTVIAIPLPPWAIHLDGTMMIVDRDLAIVHPESLHGTAIIYEEGRPPRRVQALRALRQRGLRFIVVTAYERQRRATNVITLAPRRLVAYGGNARVSKALAKEGVDVIEVEGSELVRGGGGPRCMTAPVERDGHPTPKRSTPMTDGRFE